MHGDWCRNFSMSWMGRGSEARCAGWCPVKDDVVHPTVGRPLDGLFLGALLFVYGWYSES